MKFHIYRDRKREYRWRLKANNGRIIANSGEGYKRRRGCIEVFRKIVDAHLTMSLAGAAGETLARKNDETAA